MLADDDNVMWSQGTPIDCSEIINHVTEVTKQDMSQFKLTLESQQTQINSLIQTIDGLRETIVLSTHANNAPDGTAQNGSNALDGAQPENTAQNGSNAPDGAQPKNIISGGVVPPDGENSFNASEDIIRNSDALSTQASNLWFGGNFPSAPSPSSQAGSNKENSKGTSKRSLEPEQLYWEDSLRDYQDTSKATGQEVASSVAGAAKVYWQKPLKEEAFK